jgi:hypothetical protein
MLNLNKLSDRWERGAHLHDIHTFKARMLMKTMRREKNYPVHLSKQMTYQEMPECY